MVLRQECRAQHPVLHDHASSCISKEAHVPETYITDRQLATRYNVHHLTPRRWVRDNPEFPRPIKLTPGCSRWKLSEIEAWETGKCQTAE